MQLVIPNMTETLFQMNISEIYAVDSIPSFPTIISPMTIPTGFRLSHGDKQEICFFQTGLTTLFIRKRHTIWLIFKKTPSKTEGVFLCCLICFIGGKFIIYAAYRLIAHLGRYAASGFDNFRLISTTASILIISPGINGNTQ